MAEPADNSVSIRFSDPKVLILLAAAIGGQFVASKVSLSTVESQQQHVAEATNRNADKVSDKLAEMKATQDQLNWQLGEIRYRLAAVEARVSETDIKKGSR